MAKGFNGLRGKAIPATFDTISPAPVTAIEGVPAPTLKRIVSSPAVPAVQASTAALVLAAMIASRNVQLPLTVLSSAVVLTVIVANSVAVTVGLATAALALPGRANQFRAALPEVPPQKLNATNNNNKRLPTNFRLPRYIGATVCVVRMWRSAPFSI